MACSSQPMILSGSKNTSVGTIESNGAGRDMISSTINFNFPPAPSPTRTPSFLNQIMSRLWLMPASPGNVQMLEAPTSDDALPTVGDTFATRMSDDATKEAIPETLSSSPGLSQCSDPDEDFTTTPIEHLDLRMINKLTTPQVYVHSLLSSGHGLPCWRPRPSSGHRGTVPGDVGTYTAEGGFKKMFNLWDDESAVRATSSILRCARSYRAPERNVKLDENEFHRGDTVMQGATADIRQTSAQNLPPESFAFQCRGQQGAVLALTASADLEEVDGYAQLRQHICQHAELIYRHADRVRTIGEEETLYIITGSIKSNSYALAAYQEAMCEPNNVLKLVKQQGPSDTDPTGNATQHYTWTRRGTAQARMGASQHPGVKDQSLFLRGFKLDFSASFRARIKNETFAAERRESNDPRRQAGGGSDDHTHQGDRPGRRRGDTNGRWSPGNSGGGGTQDRIGSADFRLESFPSDSRQNTCHPCDAITERLLATTGMDFALSHDDDWRFLVNGSSPITGSNAGPTGIMDSSENMSIVIQHGVAFLSSEPPASELPDLGYESDSTVETTDSEDEWDCSPRTSRRNLRSHTRTPTSLPAIDGPALQPQTPASQSDYTSERSARCQNSTNLTFDAPKPSLSVREESNRFCSETLAEPESLNPCQSQAQNIGYDPTYTVGFIHEPASFLGPVSLSEDNCSSDDTLNYQTAVLFDDIGQYPEFSSETILGDETNFNDLGRFSPYSPDYEPRPMDIPQPRPHHSSQFLKNNQLMPDIPIYLRPSAGMVDSSAACQAWPAFDLAQSPYDPHNMNPVTGFGFDTGLGDLYEPAGYQDSLILPSPENFSALSPWSNSELPSVAGNQTNGQGIRIQSPLLGLKRSARNRASSWINRESTLSPPPDPGSTVIFQAGHSRRRSGRRSGFHTGEASQSLLSPSAVPFQGNEHDDLSMVPKCGTLDRPISPLRSSNFRETHRNHQDHNPVSKSPLSASQRSPSAFSKIADPYPVVAASLANLEATDTRSSVPVQCQLSVINLSWQEPRRSFTPIRDLGLKNTPRVHHRNDLIGGHKLGFNFEDCKSEDSRGNPSTPPDCRAQELPRERSLAFQDAWNLRFNDPLPQQNDLRSQTSRPSLTSREDHYSSMLHNAFLSLAWSFQDDRIARGFESRRRSIGEAERRVEVGHSEINLCTFGEPIIVSMHQSGAHQTPGFMYFGIAPHSSHRQQDMLHTLSSATIHPYPTLDPHITSVNILNLARDNISAFGVSEDLHWSLYVGRDFALDPAPQGNYEDVASLVRLERTPFQTPVESAVVYTTDALELAQNNPSAFSVFEDSNWHLYARRESALEAALQRNHPAPVPARGERTSTTTHHHPTNLNLLLHGFDMPTETCSAIPHSKAHTALLLTTGLTPTSRGRIDTLLRPDHTLNLSFHATFLEDI